MADEDDDYGKFEITESDLNNEFLPGFRRRGLTKDQQIYGIWSEKDDTEERSSTSTREANSHYKSKRVQKGLNFVAGGIQQAGKDKTENEDEEEDLKSFYPKPMFGTQLDSSDEEDTEPLELISKSDSKFSRGGRKSNSGTTFQNYAHEKEIGEWEKHTTGIGSKLMKMMGYKEGKGLGKNLQGISTPVETQKRKGKGAIGFYGSENVNRKEVSSLTLEKDEPAREGGQGGRWRKSETKKTKNLYRTAEEVILEGKLKHKPNKFDSHITSTKVIDMTGPETRVLSSYQAIGTQKPSVTEQVDISHKFENFDIPELLHNLDLLLEKNEDSIVRNAKVLEMEDNKIIHLNHERENYEVLLERDEKKMKDMEAALTLVNILKSKHDNSTLNLREASCIFSKLKKDHWEIFMSFEIRYLCIFYVLPLLKHLFITWNPLKDPNSHTDCMSDWRNLIEKDGPTLEYSQPPNETIMDPYHRLLWETWYRSVQCCVMGVWEPHDCNSLTAVFDAWKPPIIPQWMYSHTLRSTVLPRITLAVNEWNPMQDTVPIHTWLHPWLPLLADDLQAVYPVIRQKLSAALVHWHPSDRSAKMVLQPWKDVFSELSMISLIQSSIQPKLEIALLEMPINPHNQKVEVWRWFTDWQDFLPTSSIEVILVRCFFPKWFQVLGSWLSLNPPCSEVIAWYKFWKDLMPNKTCTSLQVQQKFQQALDICKRALSYQVGSSEQFSQLINALRDPRAEKVSFEEPVRSVSGGTKDWAEIISSNNSVNSVKRDNLSMREIVERRCGERGIVFYPLPDRNYNGRPIYKCGKTNISFNKNVIFVQEESGWMPQSIAKLFEAA